MAKKRSDAERRLRQCERLSRLIRVLGCISGSGRWDAEALARELEVSQRTIHRDLQTLTLAGVPWFFDQESQAYRVRAGFRFPVVQVGVGRKSVDLTMILNTARQVIADAEKLVETLKILCSSLESEDRCQH
jgi:predicted DNA-binding transcriptional regulator YafY